MSCWRMLSLRRARATRGEPAECFLNVTNEPNDLEEADINDVKGSQVADISLEGLGIALSAQGRGSAAQRRSPSPRRGIRHARRSGGGKERPDHCFPVDGVTSNSTPPGDRRSELEAGRTTASCGI